MIEKLIRETKNIVVLFCKYAGYILIAVTHTCYMLRHYSGSNPTASSVVATRNTLQQNGEHSGKIQLNGDFLTAEQKPDTYLPPDKVKGLAKEF